LRRVPENVNLEEHRQMSERQAKDGVKVDARNLGRSVNSALKWGVSAEEAIKLLEESLPPGLLEALAARAKGKKGTKAMSSLEAGRGGALVRPPPKPPKLPRPGPSPPVKVPRIHKAMGHTPECQCPACADGRSAAGGPGPVAPQDRPSQITKDLLEEEPCSCGSCPVCQLSHCTNLSQQVCEIDRERPALAEELRQLRGVKRVIAEEFAAGGPYRQQSELDDRLREVTAKLTALDRRRAELIRALCDDCGVCEMPRVP
jgi:hypothetical protein